MAWLAAVAGKAVAAKLAGSALGKLGGAGASGGASKIGEAIGGAAGSGAGLQPLLQAPGLPMVGAWPYTATPMMGYRDYLSQLLQRY